MPITVQNLRRFEKWTDWQCAGGERAYIIPDATNILAVSNITLADKLTFTVPLQSPTSAQMIKGTVLRIDQDDLTFDEWKITDREDDTQAGTAQITAGTFATTDLTTCGFVSRLDSDGTRVYEFESLGISPTAQIAQWVLPATPSFVTIGSILSSDPIDMTYAWDTPLAALQTMATNLVGELQVRRVGSLGYAIEIVDEIGHDAPTCDLRYQKNVLKFGRTITSDGHATRVFPQGQADSDNAKATMSQACWVVTAVSVVGSATTVTLADPAGGDGPLEFDNQLVGLGNIFIRSANGTLYGLSASSATDQTVTIPAAIIEGDIQVGDMIDFRTDAVGSVSNDLTWLDSPSDVATWGVINSVLDAGDIPGHRNLALNSALRFWPTGSGTLPDHWAIVNPGGEIDVARQTVAPYVLVGENSIKCATTNDGQGFVTDSVRITPSSTNPYNSAFASVWTVSGNVRVELVYTTPTGEVVVPVPPAVASNSETGQWEDLGVAGQDANSLSATAVAVRIVQQGISPAVFYIGRAQITQSASQLPFVEGSGGTQLWQAANEQLRTNGAPIVSYDASIVDLARIDPETWGADTTLSIGGTVLVTDPRFPIQILTRIVEVQRYYQEPGNSTLTISSKPDDLSGSYARPKKKGRIVPSFVATAAAPTVTAIQADLNTAGNPAILVFASSDALSFKVAVSILGIPDDSTVEASTPISGSKGAVLFSSIVVNPGDTLYGKAFAYKADAGAGLRSPSMPFSVPFAAIRRDAPWADGAYALAATDSLGLTADSGVTDSSGLASRKINLSLAKASSGSPDDLRSVPDGGGYNRTTSTYVDSSGRIVSVLNSANIGGKTAADLAVQTGTTVFSENGDTFDPTNGVWNFNNPGSIVYRTNDTSYAHKGNNTLNFAVYEQVTGKRPIALDPTKLYRIRIGLQAVDNTSPAVQYCGITAYRADMSGANSNSGACYCALAARSINSSANYDIYEGWFTAGEGSFSADYSSECPSASAPMILPAGTTCFVPYVLINYLTGNQNFLWDFIDITEYDEVASAFTYGGFSGVGSIASGVTQGDAAGGRVMLRGRQSGTCRNGDSISFTPPFQNTPAVRFWGGIPWEPRNRYGTTGDGTESGAPNAGLPGYPMIQARNLTASGFVCDARIKQKVGTSSPVTDNWVTTPTISGIASGSSVGVTTGSLAPSDAPASGDTYSVELSGTIDFVYRPGHGDAQTFSVVVAVDVDPTGLGAWSEAGVNTFVTTASANGSSTYYATINVVQSGLTSSSKFRLRVKAVSNSSGSSSASVTAEDIRYQHTTGTADQFASMTPDSDDVVYYDATEASLT